jgi:solute carrier family 35 (UDP-xylose/UDP-N-acetylglucosamine transporter), member B4
MLCYTFISPYIFDFFRFYAECGHLVSFVQFSFVTLCELPAQLEWRPNIASALDLIFPIRLKKRSIPLHQWLITVLLFFSVSFMNNFALTYNLPMPYHILFRSTTLMASMLICYLLVGRR